MRRAILVAVCMSCRSDADKAANGVHDVLLSEIDEFVDATEELEVAAAPSPWTPAAVATMRAKWLRANFAYERIEGPLAPVFPDLAISIDDRWEAQLRGRVDPNPFDDSPVRGLRAIERILWADSIPPSVTELERTVPGYSPARFPANAGEAGDFKDKLCAHLVADARQLREQWHAQKPDLPFALDSIYWSIKELRMEITKAATHDEESAYAGVSMAVLRANVQGARAIYAKIRPLVVARHATDADRDLTAALDELEARLSGGDALPAPPASWSSEHPSAVDLESPFGVIHASIAGAFDSSRPASAVSALRRIGAALGSSYVPPT